MSGEQRTFFADVLQSSSLLEVKMNKLLEWFKYIVEGDIDKNVSFVLYSTLDFFSDNSHLNKTYLLNGLNKFFSTMNKHERKIFRVLSIGKYHTRLKKLQSKCLFRKSSPYWKLLYEIKEEKEDLENAKDIRLYFNTIYNEERPALTKRLRILQEAHDSFERHRCCTMKHRILYFYFQKLLSTANSANVQKAFYSDPKFLLIIENVKEEIARLLKCLSGIKLKTRPCRHNLLKFKKSKLIYELIDGITAFYLPKNIPKLIDTDEVSKEIYEICKQMKCVAEKESRDLSDMSSRFDDYLSTTPESIPICQSFNDNTMVKLDPHFYDLRVIQSRFGRHKELVPYQIGAKALYFNFYYQFKRDGNDKIIDKRVKPLVLEQNDLDDKSIAHIWFINARCLLNNMGPDFNVNQCKKAIFLFHTSLLFDKENAETHLWLAMILRRLYLNETSKAEDLQHSRMHLKFASTYIQKETKIHRVIIILNDFLTFTQCNYIDDRDNVANNFVKISTQYLAKLIEKETRDPSVYSVNFIDKMHKSLFGLFEKTKCYGLFDETDDMNLAIEMLKEAWINGVKRPEQSEDPNDQFYDIPPDELDEQIDLKTKNNQLFQSSIEDDDIQYIYKTFQKKSTDRSTQTKSAKSNCKKCQLSVNLSQPQSVDQNESNIHKHLFLDEKTSKIAGQLEKELEVEQQKLSQSTQNIFDLKLKIATVERDAKILKLEADLKSFIDERNDMFKENEQLKNDNEKMRQVMEEEEQEKERQIATKRHRLEEEAKLNKAKRARLGNILKKSQHI